MNTVIEAKIGQTIRIYNDDTQNHRLHTSGAPCPHQPNNTPPGGFFDCVVSQAIEPNFDNSRTYNHNVNESAAVYIRATP